ncbi:MAG TPA: DUF1080 domain-containing protein [Emcibacteraceae bacterium]|nr:DUF1080 domain-containing protein [Emcibacteraceae bacterium]
MIRSLFTCTAALCMVMSAQAQDSVSLFDGRTLTGWNTEEPEIWRIEDGMLTGGELDQEIPANTFIVTDDTFQNFELFLKVRLLGSEGFINSGFQIRSMPVNGNGEMSGYQVDAGDGWWGKLYDESRRDKVIAESADMDAIDKAVKRGDWNEYHIIADGRHIRSWINGVPALDYTETDLTIPQEGHIAIQAHAGGKTKVQVKDIKIKRLKSDPDLPTWQQYGLPMAKEN